MLILNKETDLANYTDYKGNISFPESTSVNFNLSCQGYLSCGGSLSCGGDLYCRGSLYCGGDLSCRGSLYCGGDLSCRGDLYCRGSLSCGGDLSCRGSLYCGGDLFCGGDLYWSHISKPMVMGTLKAKRVLPPAWQCEYWQERLAGIVEFNADSCYDSILKALIPKLDDVLAMDKWTSTERWMLESLKIQTS